MSASVIKAACAMWPHLKEARNVSPLDIQIEGRKNYSSGPMRNWAQLPPQTDVTSAWEACNNWLFSVTELG